MRFFSEEDNKKLYESNLPDILKNYIANFNEIMICFLKEKYSNKENLDEILNKIKESFKKTEYKINENIGSNASFSYNLFTKDQTFEINDKTLNMYSIEEGLIGIYFHEFSHFISYTLDSNKSSRLEEGIADLFSNEVTEYFNKSFSKRKVINYKDSVYKKPAIIIRNACLINNNSEDLIWNYYTDKEKLKEFFEKAYGKEATNLIFEIEDATNDFNYISEKEKEYIEQALDKIDVLNSKEIYINLNPLLHKKIYEKAKEQSLSLEDLKNNYPNISSDFYKDYEINFSNVNTKKENLINKENISESDINSLIEEFLNYIDINKFKNPNLKYGIYNDYTIDMPLELTKYNNIFALNFGNLIPTLYAYKKVYNKEEYNQEEFIETLLSLGYDHYLSKKEFNTIVSLSKEVYKNFKNKSNDENFENIKKQIKEHLEKIFNIEYYTEKYKNNKININEFVNKMIELYKKSEKEYCFGSNSYITSIIKNYTKNEDLSLSLENFEIIKNKINEFIKDLDIPYIIDINAQILWAWNTEKKSIYDVVEIVSKYGIDSTAQENMFRNINTEGLKEIKNEKNLKNIIRYINATTQKNYLNSKVFYYHKQGYKYDESEAVKKSYDEIINKIRQYSNENNEYINNKLINNDKNFIRFLKKKTYTELDEESIKILKEITGKEGTKQLSSYTTGKYDNELYEKLKKYPYLAAIYISYYYPDDVCSILSMKLSLSKSKEIENECLKEAYKNQFIKFVKEFNENYKLEEEDLKFVDIYELDLLEKIPTNILDEETEKQFERKLLDSINEKIKKIFIEEHETKSDIRLLKRNIESKIQRNLENCRSEIKEELQKTYDELKNIKLTEPEKQNINFNNLNEAIKNIVNSSNRNK